MRVRILCVVISVGNITGFTCMFVCLLCLLSEQGDSKDKSVKIILKRFETYTFEKL